MEKEIKIAERLALLMSGKEVRGEKMVTESD